MREYIRDLASQIEVIATSSRWRSDKLNELNRDNVADLAATEYFTAHKLKRETTFFEFLPVQRVCHDITTVACNITTNKVPVISITRNQFDRVICSCMGVVKRPVACGLKVINRSSEIPEWNTGPGIVTVSVRHAMT